MTHPNSEQKSSDDPLVTVRICYEMTEAQVLRGLLEQHDIPTIIDNEYISSIIPSLTSQMTLPVKVRLEDEHRAKLLIDNVQPLAGNQPRYLLELEECPACGSSRILQYRGFLPWLFGLKKLDIEGPYHRCVACGNRWRAEGSRRENQMLLAIFGSFVAFGIIWLLLYSISWLKYHL